MRLGRCAAVIIMCCTLAACGSSGKGKSADTVASSASDSSRPSFAPTTIAPPTTTAPAAPTAIGEAVALQEADSTTGTTATATYTALATVPNPRPTTDYESPPTGKYYAVRVEIDGTSAAAYSYNLNDFDLQATDGQIFTPTVDSDFGKVIEEGSVVQGQRVIGLLVFDIPKTETPSVLNVQSRYGVLGSWALS